MREVIILPEAEDDLARAVDYVAADSPTHAESLLENFYAKIASIAEYPTAGHRRNDSPNSRYRFWRFKSYLIIYEFDDRVVKVIRVLHGARDIKNLL